VEPDRTMDVTARDGVRLSARVWDGPAGRPIHPGLLLHHGLASSMRIWDLMIPRLAASRRVVAFDARGHGLSGKPSTGYDLEATSADALAVARATGLGRPVVVGHSWGGTVALEIADRHPRSIAGAVLVDGGLVRMQATFPDWGSARRALAPPELAGTPVEQFRGMIRSFLGAELDVTPELEDIILSVMRVDREGRIHPRLSRTNHLRILRAIWEQDPIAAFARLRVPVLAIAARREGTDDDFTSAKRRGMAEARRASRGRPARFRWMEGIHDLPLQRPEALARAVERFAREAVG
jgi:pimeloyl-ACP methyl ester carboxylesterase